MGMSTRGHELWAGFLAAVGATEAEAARAISVSRGVLSQWKDGQRPRAEIRARIARWTRGRVPPVAWMTDEERAAIEAVQPVRRSRLPKKGGAL